MSAAVENGPEQVLAVTVLTSLSDEDVQRIYRRDDVMGAVMEMTFDAADAGLGGIVCSPREVGILNELRKGGRFGLQITLPESIRFVVPGTRSDGVSKNDQKRSTTPLEAVRRGADYLVIGREVTQADDPIAALERIITDISTDGDGGHDG
jgi:orotidine-5'-phosphate decarboxylase